MITVTGKFENYKMENILKEEEKVDNLSKSEIISFLKRIGVSLHGDETLDQLQHAAKIFIMEGYGMKRISAVGKKTGRDFRIGDIVYSDDKGKGEVYGFEKGGLLINWDGGGFSVENRVKFNVPITHQEYYRGVKISKIKIIPGDIVAYKTIADKLRAVYVTNMGEENGKVIFDGVILQGGDLGDGVWGYVEDVNEVVRKGTLKYKEYAELLNKIKGELHLAKSRKAMLSQIPYSLEDLSKEDINKEILRAAIIAELDAVNLYEQLASMTDNKDLKKVLLDVAKEEKTHVGEFQELLYSLDEEQVKEIEEAKKEIKNLTSKRNKRAYIEIRQLCEDCGKKFRLDDYADNECPNCGSRNYRQVEDVYDNENPYYVEPDDEFGGRSNDVW